MDAVTDITARKHQGNPASVAANEMADRKKILSRTEIYRMALRVGQYGITVKEVVTILGIPIQSASARLSEMKQMGSLVVKDGPRRDRCSVLVTRFDQ